MDILPSNFGPIVIQLAQEKQNEEKDNALSCASNIDDIPILEEVDPSKMTAENKRDNIMNDSGDVNMVEREYYKQVTQYSFGYKISVEKVIISTADRDQPSSKVELYIEDEDIQTLHIINGDNLHFDTNAGYFDENTKRFRTNLVSEIEKEKTSRKCMGAERLERVVQNLIIQFKNKIHETKELITKCNERYKRRLNKPPPIIQYDPNDHELDDIIIEKEKQLINIKKKHYSLRYDTERNIITMIQTEDENIKGQCKREMNQTKIEMIDLEILNYQIESEIVLYRRNPNLLELLNDYKSELLKLETKEKQVHDYFTVFKIYKNVHHSRYYFQIIAFDNTDLEADLADNIIFAKKGAFTIDELVMFISQRLLLFYQSLNQDDEDYAERSNFVRIQSLEKNNPPLERDAINIRDFDLYETIFLNIIINNQLNKDTIVYQYEENDESYDDPIKIWNRLNGLIDEN